MIHEIVFPIHILSEHGRKIGGHSEGVIADPKYVLFRGPLLAIFAYAHMHQFRGSTNIYELNLGQIAKNSITNTTQEETLN